MTQTPPKLSDRAKLLQQRSRALQPDGLFLHAAAADDIQDRLSMVNRDFTKIAIVTGFPEFWRTRFPAADVVTDDEILSLRPDHYDLVVHALALHWANDPVGQLIQCRHALQKDGLLISASFGGNCLQELRASLSQAEANLTGGLSARILPMGEIRDLGALLQRAGFALPVADSIPFKVSYQDIWHLMRDLRAMGETNALTLRARHFTKRQIFQTAQRIYAENYSENSRLPATFDMIFMTGWKPDDSQQKPLRPGSAAMRLADALGTQETKLKS